MHFHRHIRLQLRPLRPPLRLHIPRKSPTRARFFTRNTQLLLISPAIPRPQLGFLPQLCHLPARKQGQLQSALSRLISTQTKRYLKEQAWQGGKWTMWGTIFSTLGLTWLFIATHELLDREFPAPPEWSHRTRFRYHSAKGIETPESLLGITDWASTGDVWRRTVEGLEDPNLDGKGLVQQGEEEGEGETEGGILVAGVEEMGYDISGKSEPWRRGYHEALMGCARSAEHLYGDVLDITRGHVFSPCFVIGPSNPNPTPTPPWRPSAPLEENCVPAYEPPEAYYLKIVTTKGFTTRQRMEAAVAYAEWLDHKGMHERAEEMIRWASNLAMSRLTIPSSVVNTYSGTIQADAQGVTENILFAATALAIHQATLGDTSTALPIFLSVLRARRNAPIGLPAPVTPLAQQQTAQTDIAAMGNVVKSLWSLLQEVKYPPPPPTGDEPLLRTPDESAEEAGVMLYVGEILFASSKEQHESGIAWTRDGVELAEKCSKDPTVQTEAKKRAVDCLRVGLDNWRTMVSLVTEELEEETRNSSFPPHRTSWSGAVEHLLGWDIKRQEVVKKQMERWTREEKELRRYELSVDRARLLEMFKRDGKPIWSSWLLNIKF
ncbi:hypothetical protein EJ08DRAFT_651411 [Tothia fuscella]|uniref:Uncharacterized protein n=1 Tax=Tothia fuscella TaxID=1048955 RepID=A0A9P4NMC8_9PEZI|nr:hypothetical protein EJ08DRAFT_651411 [Tothia fuscella]